MDMSQYQPRLSSINNVAPGRSAHQIAVLTEIIVIKIEETLNFVAIIV
jgi:hypothetical protein